MILDATKMNNFVSIYLYFYNSQIILIMKKITFLFSGLFLMMALTFTNKAQAQEKNINDYLKISEIVHDFGKTPYGKAVEFDINFTNLSKDSVKIENVKVGCGCTTPKWSAGPYAAGSTFKITLGFNGYSEGHIEKYVDIYFSEGLHQQIKFIGEGYKVPENPAPQNASAQKMKTNN